MSFLRFFLLQLKRIAKNKAFLLLLLLFPVCLFLFAQTFRAEEDSRIPVGLCLQTEDMLADTLCEKLLTGNDSLFRFFAVSSEEELTKLVQSNQAECGYLFHKPLLTELDNRHTKNLITVLVSEHTTCKAVLNELVYAKLFEEYSLHLLIETLQATNQLPFTESAANAFLLPPVTEKTISEAYRTHLSEDTFTFEIVSLSSEQSEKSSVGTASTVVPLFRGFAAIFLLLCGFLGLLAVQKDCKNGLYQRLHGVAQPFCATLTMLSYLLPGGAFSLLALSVSGNRKGIATELFALLCYQLLLLAFYGLWGRLLRNHTMLCAAFPMLLLCTLVFTPVIVDLSAFFPWIRLVRYALPTYYYLLFF